MSYNFIKNKYPYSDPNIDLNFNNDILYQYIVDDDYKDSKLPHYQNGNVKPRENKVKNYDNRKKDNKNVYVMFIVCAIVIMLIWYVHLHNRSNTTAKTIPTPHPTNFVVLNSELGQYRALLNT